MGYYNGRDLIRKRKRKRKRTRKGQESDGCPSQALAEMPCKPDMGLRPSLVDGEVRIIGRDNKTIHLGCLVGGRLTKRTRAGE